MKLYLFFEILNISLKASIVILFVLLVRRLLKKMPKVFSYALWIVVLFRLLCPVSFESPISFIPEKISNGSALKSVIDCYIGENEVYWDSTEEYDTAIQQGLEPVIVSEKESGNAGAYVVVDKDGVSEAKTIYNSWIPVLCNVWIIGIVVLVCYHIFSYIRLKRRLVGCVPYNDEEDIYFSDYIDTPFVIGFYYPCIYLPSALGGQDLYYVLLHERQHIRRKDHVLKAFALIVLCVYWFNPLVWIAFIFMCKDMETSCDEAVLRKLGDEAKADYSTTLLNLTVGKEKLSGITIAFGEGDIKYRIKNILQWKRPVLKWIVISVVVCTIAIILCVVNPKDTMVKHPYDWSHSVTTDDIESFSASSWGDKSVQYYVSEKEIKDLVYVLNELTWMDFQQGNAIAGNEFTIVLVCDGREYLLTYGAGTTMFSFENGDRENSGVWKTENEKLAKCLKQIMNESLQVISTVPKSQPQPLKKHVLEMRNKVLDGMTEEEIKQVKEMVQKGNAYGEGSYLHGLKFRNFREPESLYWNIFTESGDIVIGHAFDTNQPKYDSNNGMTEDEYNAKYGEPVVMSVSAPVGERFYSYIDNLENLLKTDLLDEDFEEIRNCMKLAIETHDVNYLYEIYYKFHDLDYYLFRYGPEDISPLVGYASCIEIYYGCLNVYEGVLPVVTKAYKVENEYYYKMSDDTWRMGLNSYKYKLEIKGKTKNESKNTHFVVLSNRKNIAFEDVWEANIGKKFPVDEAVIVFYWQN